MSAHLALLPVLAVPLLLGAPGDTSIPKGFEPERFAQTAAESFEDYYGRAVLIEYFAHW